MGTWFTYGHRRFTSAELAAVSPQTRFCTLPSPHLQQKVQSQRSTPRQRSLIYHPPEVLCQIFHHAVEDLGIKRLLPILHVCYQWRCSALSDSSLWATIYLSDITPPLFDMTLTYASSRPFKVHVDHLDINHVAKLWEFVDRIEELDCWPGIHANLLFLSSLGPASNLKVFRLRNATQGPAGWQLPVLPNIFQGCLPLLRDGGDLVRWSVQGP